MLFGGETGIGVHLGLTWWMLARSQACGKWGVSVWSQYRWVGVASNEVEVHCHSVEGVCVGPSVAVPRAVCRFLRKTGRLIASAMCLELFRGKRYGTEKRSHTLSCNRMTRLWNGMERHTCPEPWSFGTACLTTE